MPSARQLREAYHSWKRLFLQNWTLFRASRIGVVGLAIMIAFVLVALAAPYVGLRDPIYWLAPESDTISVQQFWSVNVAPGSPLQGINASVEHSVAFRPARDLQAFDIRADRIYVPEGRRLFAFQTDHGYLAWPSPFVADDNISVDPVLANFGRLGSPTDSIFTLFLGTRAGTVYVMTDDYLPAATPTARSANFGSPVTGLAAFSGDEVAGMTDKDRFVVGTEDGHLYAFVVNRSGNWRGFSFYQELWNVTVNPSGAATAPPIHLAGAMIKSKFTPSILSPCFYHSSVDSTKDGQTVILGTGDGWLASVWMSNGSFAWAPRRLSATTWSSAPIVRVGAELPGTPTLVYAATDESKVFTLYADNGDSLRSWVDAARDPSGGLHIIYPRVVGVPDTGILFTPMVFGPNIFVTSSSGWIYSIYRDPIRGAGNQIVFDSGEVAWGFRDDTLQHDTTHKTYFRAGPHIFDNLNLVIAAGNYNNGTTDPSDDLGIVYVFNAAGGGLSWKRTFSSRLLATPVAWWDPFNTHQGTWFGTSTGEVYAFSTSGQYVAPLAPSWAHTYLDPSNHLRQGYPSGNTYILGTDARGRDIFSQLLWGSRVALLVGFASAIFTISIGVIVGLVAGYLGGRVESILMRFTDVILVIPVLPLVIILAAVLGAGVGNIILVISIVGWPGVARVIRAEVLSLKERPFIDSARVTGASNVRIMFRHIAPNVAPLAFLYMTFAVSGAILTEAALSFIGLGDVSTISWGIMLQDVSQSKALQAWWWLLPPGLAITLISLAFFLVGRAFDEIVNPRLRKR